MRCESDHFLSICCGSCKGSHALVSLCNRACARMIFAWYPLSDSEYVARYGLLDISWKKLTSSESSLLNLVSVLAVSLTSSKDPFGCLWEKLWWMSVACISAVAHLEFLFLTFSANSKVPEGPKFLDLSDQFRLKSVIFFNVMLHGVQVLGRSKQC